MQIEVCLILRSKVVAFIFLNYALRYRLSLSAAEYHKLDFFFCKGKGLLWELFYFLTICFGVFRVQKNLHKNIFFLTKKKRFMNQFTWTTTSTILSSKMMIMSFLKRFVRYIISLLHSEYFDKLLSVFETFKWWKTMTGIKYVFN